jgi:polyisoprenoid-binding protein YceI
MRTFASVFALPILAGAVAATARGDEFAIDLSHSAVSFQISHMGLSYTHGRFNEFGGNFTIDSSDPSKSTFALSIKTESIDTNSAGRDKHLKSPDFFNAKQFPAITFASTAVKPIEGGYEVSGDLTIHGETKPVTFTLKGGKTIQPPQGGGLRTGFSTSQIVVKRSEFGVGKPTPMLGDDVYVSISFEGSKK